MKQRPKITAALIFFAVGFITVVAGLRVADIVGTLTNSRLLGICGPSGPYAGLLGCIFLASLPAGIVMGVLAARYYYRRRSK